MSLLNVPGAFSSQTVPLLISRRPVLILFSAVKVVVKVPSGMCTCDLHESHSESCSVGDSQHKI